MKFPFAFQNKVALWPNHSQKFRNRWILVPAAYSDCKICNPKLSFRIIFAVRGVRAGIRLAGAHDISCRRLSASWKNGRSQLAGGGGR